MGDLMRGRRCLVMGASSHRSIGWGIARALHREGAALAFSYSSERSKARLDDLVDTLPDGARVPRFQCDVGSDDEIASLFRRLGEHWDGALDVFVHTAGHARAEELSGSYLDISRDGYAFAHSLSAYSLVVCAREAAPLLVAGATQHAGAQGGGGAQNAGPQQGVVPGGSSIITITYPAGQRVMPYYNVMASAKAALETHVRYLAAELGPRGIRVNAISAGPIRTLSASAVKSLAAGRRQMEERAPLRRNVETEDVGNVALFLASDLARSITGEILNADNGLYVLGI
jgi:enoyl-[acyl-carrier protein] reductase I